MVDPARPQDPAPQASASSQAPAPAPGPTGPRRRKPPRRVEVVSVSRINPRMVSVWVGGEALDGFAINAPTSHIKVYLPAAGKVRRQCLTRGVVAGAGLAGQFGDRALAGDQRELARRQGGAVEQHRVGLDDGGRYRCLGHARSAL